MVCGIARDVGRLEVTVTGWLGFVIASAQIVGPPPNWIAYFPNLKVKHWRRYTLQVREVGGKSRLAMSITFKRPSYATLISSPDNTGTLCHLNCVANGTTTAADPVQGYLTIGGTRYNGTPVQNMPARTWGLQWAGLPTGTGVSLDVSNSAGPDHRSDLTINGC